MKVYVIEKGQYSDRHVVCVVENKKEAKQICDALNASGYAYRNDAEWTEYDTASFNTSLMRWLVTNYYSDDWVAEYDDYDLYSKYTENTCDYEDHYIIYANSPQQAIKIAQDMAAQIRAQEEGIT